MLTHLSIRHFTIADHIELEFQPGMTVITGETGAGKSISLDALALTLGDRADSRTISHGAQRAEIVATFDLTQLPDAQEWLIDHDMEQDNDCLLRRIITREGRSRAYINGQPCTLQELKALGEMLIDIHSQHEHQSLLQRDCQRRYLDAYCNANDLALEVKKACTQWQNCTNRLRSLQANDEEKNARLQLLSYQAQELDSLALAENELAKLEEEHKILSHAEQTIQDSQLAMNFLSNADSGSAIENLNQASRLLSNIAQQNDRLSEISQLIISAQIQTEEASRELQYHIDNFEADPQRLTEVETRLNAIYQIARKHRIKAEELPGFYQQLKEELSELQSGDEQIEILQQQQEELAKQYDLLAKRLSNKREKGSSKLKKAVTKQLSKLGMENCRFEIHLPQKETAAPSLNGLESVDFLISTNPGQPAQALNKIASGGELSRISLAIQVITAQTSSTPTLIFDEVDVGIGGGTAEVVGNLLRLLGNKNQVICVTHQAQVAAKGHHHVRVSKQIDKDKTLVEAENLLESNKIDEIARMLGGLEITERTMAHAREMLETTD